MKKKWQQQTEKKTDDKPIEKLKMHLNINLTQHNYQCDSGISPKIG